MPGVDGRSLTCSGSNRVDIRERASVGKRVPVPTFRKDLSVTQRYEMTIKAEGEVRDADGNLVSNEVLTGQTVLTEEQAKALLEKFEQAEEER